MKSTVQCLSSIYGHVHPSSKSFSLPENSRCS